MQQKQIGKQVSVTQFDSNSLPERQKFSKLLLNVILFDKKAEIEEVRPSMKYSALIVRQGMELGLELQQSFQDEEDFIARAINYMQCIRSCKCGRFIIEWEYYSQKGKKETLEFQIKKTEKDWSNQLTMWLDEKWKYLIALTNLPRVRLQDDFQDEASIDSCGEEVGKDIKQSSCLKKRVKNSRSLEEKGPEDMKQKALETVPYYDLCEGLMVDETKEQMISLWEMGFKQYYTNLRLLQIHNYNMDKVIEDLTVQTIQSSEEDLSQSQSDYSKESKRQGKHKDSKQIKKDKKNRLDKKEIGQKTKKTNK